MLNIKTRKQEEEGMREDYKDHIATHLIYENGENKMEKLRWEKAGTSNHMVIYVITGEFLFVCGDLGEAIYQWSDQISFEWLAGLDIDYFNGKCQASEIGRDYKEWRKTEAYETIEYNFAVISEDADCTCEDEDEDCKCVEKYKDTLWKNFREAGGEGYLYSEQDWYEWCRENAEDVLGSDWQEWAGGIGEVISSRCKLHLLGIKMAVKQLKSE